VATAAVTVAAVTVAAVTVEGVEMAVEAAASDTGPPRS
jgi:hypothetical protein